MGIYNHLTTTSLSYSEIFVILKNQTIHHA